MRDRRYVDELTIEELEEVLITRRREERLARVRRIGAAGRPGMPVTLDEPLYRGDGSWDAAHGAEAGSAAGSAKASGAIQVWRDRILLVIETAALVGLIAVIISLLMSVRSLNQDWKTQQSIASGPTPTPTALIKVSILPGGHKPPTVSGGEGQPLGPVPVLTLPTPGPRAPTRLIISSIHVDVNVVEGDDWEQLKKGAGHHIGSANPGERGNCFISGHNDVYGEIFRDLEDVQVGNEIIVYAGDQPYRYVVRAPPRIVEPDDVSIMYPTTGPVLTLLTCHPYMVDTHRLVVIAELDE
jgi:sortase A